MAATAMYVNRRSASPALLGTGECLITTSANKSGQRESHTFVPTAQPHSAFTLIGMALITTGIASPLVLAGRRWSGTVQHIRVYTGFLSLGFGVWLIYRIGWLDGLFRALPHWDPH